MREPDDNDENDNNVLRGIDLDAWQPPAPRGDLASAVIERMAATPATAAPDVSAVRSKRTVWLASGAAIGVAIIAIGVLALRTPAEGEEVRSDRGGVVATRPDHFELDGVAVELDAGAELRWVREPGGLYVEGLRGRSTWKIAKDVRARIDTGAMGALVEATGASLRVEVRMNASDLRMAGTSAAIAAVVALVTVVVYEGQVKATSGGRTIVVAQGETVELEPGKPPHPPVEQTVVGIAPIAPSVPVVPPATPSVPVEQPLVGAGPVAPSVPVVPPVAPRVPVDPPAGAEATVEQATLPPDTRPAVIEGTRPEALDASMVQKGIRLVKARVMSCGDSSSAAGKVKLNVRVRPDGRVTAVVVKETPDAALGSCAAATMQSATFAATRAGGSFNYVFVFTATTAAVVTPAPAVPPCDTDALKTQGITEMNVGQYAAALVTFEAAFRCRNDRAFIQFMALNACKSGNAMKAKLYYPKVPASAQGGIAHACVSSKTPYQ